MNLLNLFGDGRRTREDQKKRALKNYYMVANLEEKQ